MRRSILLAVIAVLAVPAAAQAAPVKISPHASPVSAAGAASVEAANPNSHALRGTATVSVRDRRIATRRVRLATRSVTTIALRFDRAGLAALRAAGGRATIALRLRRRAGARETSARRTLRFRVAPGRPPAAPQAPAPPVTDGSAPPPASDGALPPAPDRWVGRMGTEGPYDDLELTAAGGQLQIIRAPTVPVSCSENGGSYRSALSFELFDAPGPWIVGTDGSAGKQGIAVNQLVGSGARTIIFKVTGTTQEPRHVAGTLGMSFFDSKYDIFTNTITFINCAGSQSFEAVPAP